MYGYIIYPTYPPLPDYSPFLSIPYFQRFTYPKVDTHVFEGSVKSFRLLFDQGSLLLDRLGDSAFAFKMMETAQQGKKVQVEDLVKSIGLKVPVTTAYTPSGVIFTLHSEVDPQSIFSCCTLTISMKWGK